jgi:hypothetical protein
MSTSAIELPNRAYMLPESIPLWPPAWPFWLVVGAVIVCAVVTLIYYGKRYHRRAYRREAEQLLPNLDLDASYQAVINDCLELIRRCLLSAKRPLDAARPISELMPLLDEQLPPRYRFGKDGVRVAASIYQAHANISKQDLERFITSTKHWIRRHHG